jgi:hypothetical protein
MREKNRYRLSIVIDVLAWITVGCASVAILQHQLGVLWLSAAGGVLFGAIALGIAISPKARRYMRKQYPGGNQFEDPRVIGRYTILEDQIIGIRESCLDELQKSQPSIVLRQWHGRRWEATAPETGSKIVYALIPGMFSDPTWTDRVAKRVGRPADFAVECCVVAQWTGQAWCPTSIFFVGNENECLVKMQQLIEDNHYPSSPF